MELLAPIGVLYALFITASIYFWLPATVLTLFILWHVFDDIGQSRTLRNPGKYLGLFGFFVLFAATINYYGWPIAIDPVSTLILFGVGGGITVLARFIESIWSSRQALTNIYAKIQDYKSYFVDNANTRLTHALKVEFPGPAQEVTDLVGAKLLNLVANAFLNKNLAHINQSSKLSLPRDVPPSMYFTADDFLSARHLIEFNEKGDIDISALVKHHWVFNSLSKMLANIEMQQLYRDESDTILNTNRHIDGQNVELTLNIPKGRFAGLLATWFVLWPFYLIELVIGRWVARLFDIIAFVIDKISLGFIKRVIFRGLL